MKGAGYYPLVTAISVLYSRPFLDSKGIGRLSKKLVPDEFLDLHSQLILLRNKAIAHTDTRDALYKGLPANSVRLLVRNHGSQVALKMNKAKIKTAENRRVR